MTTVAPLPVDNRFVTWTDWAGYRKFCDAVGERPIRINYDRGKLEMMTLGSEHEGSRKLLAQLVEALLRQLRIRYRALGSMTFEREDLDRALEPDECYWIAGFDAIRGKRKIDVAVDPPPDLVLEIDVTDSSTDRIAMYRVLRVPEVWQMLRECTKSPDPADNRLHGPTAL